MGDLAAASGHARHPVAVAEGKLFFFFSAMGWGKRQ